MNKGFSIQGGNADKPTPPENEIGIMLYCVDCKKGRNFAITKNLEMIKMREMKSMFIQSQCEECKKTIEIRIGWIEKKDGWTVKFDTPTPSYAVKDDIGLGEMEYEN